MLDFGAKISYGLSRERLRLLPQAIGFFPQSCLIQMDKMVLCNLINEIMDAGIDFFPLFLDKNIRIY